MPEETSKYDIMFSSLFAMREERIFHGKEKLMNSTIKIIVGQTTLKGELFDSPCARAVFSALPVEARPNTWGDEFYFEIPVKMSLDPSATSKVKAGDIGYWPPGQALAIFFGPTPMSTGDDPVPASEVNLVGRILHDAGFLKKEKNARSIRIEPSGASQDKY
jgi:hypothetical protein